MDLKTVLVVRKKKNIARHIVRALVSTGCTVRCTSWDKEEIAAELQKPTDMCIIDMNGGEMTQWVLERLHSHHRSIISLVVCHGVGNPILQKLLATGALNNLIAKHGGLTASTEMINETELIVTCEKLFRGDIFGLDKYLATWAIKIFDNEIRSTDDKHQCLIDLEEFLDLIECYGAIKSSIMLVADELIMNAIFNAPVNADGKPKYKDRDRRDALTLEPHEYIQFKYACDGRHVALSVADQFGSLDRDIIIKYLERCFSNGQAEIEDKVAGAGLGLFMVFSSITQLAFNIKRGVSTEVIPQFYVRSSARAFKSSGRSLNIFVVD